MAISKIFLGDLAVEGLVGMEASAKLCA